jgi:hypothetical protein
VGINGTILNTVDGGINWNPQPSGTMSDISSVYFLDQNTGWAVGNYYIFYTTNGGTNWILQSSPSLASVYFTDQNTGWAVGNGGTIIKTIDGGGIPVELTSFTANVNNKGDVILNWTTATELNNQMFEIERRSEEGQYIMIGYVNGHGTTTEPQEYSYMDNTVETGTYFYRLKQIDFLGTYEYSDEIEVDVNGPLTFGLEQNYPNPFNPSTIIKYSVPETGSIKLSIYSVIGEEAAVLVDGIVQAGFYEITFDASNLPSGVYFYRLQAGSFVETKKMLLLK